jgi:hypothetical protein
MQRNGAGEGSSSRENGLLSSEGRRAAGAAGAAPEEIGAHPVNHLGGCLVLPGTDPLIASRTRRKKE